MFLTDKDGLNGFEYQVSSFAKILVTKNNSVFSRRNNAYTDGRDSMIVINGSDMRITSM